MTKLHKMSPAQAYRAGITQGKRLAWPDVFQAVCYTVLIAMYNAKDDEKMPDEEFAEYAKKTEQELQRLIDEVFDGDPQFIGKVIVENETAETIDDKAKYFIHQVNKLRERLGMGKV